MPLILPYITVGSRTSGFGQQSLRPQGTCDAICPTNHPGHHGMIATPHYLATSAGLKVLEDGGSAMDAVICANAMLTVLYPDQTAIGGDCFFLAIDAGYRRHARLQRLRPGARAGRSRSAPRNGWIGNAGQGAVRDYGARHDRCLVCGSRAVRIAWKWPVCWSRQRPSRGMAFRSRQAGGRARRAGAFDHSLAGPAQTGLSGRQASGRRVDAPRCRPCDESLETIAREGRDAFYSGAIARGNGRHGRRRSAAGSPLMTWPRTGASGSSRSMPRPTETSRCHDATQFPGDHCPDRPAHGRSRGIPAEPWGTAQHLHPLVEAAEAAPTGCAMQTMTDPRFRGDRHCRAAC